MNEYESLYGMRDSLYGYIQYKLHPCIHSSSFVDWSHYEKKDKTVDTLKELTKRYRQIRQDVEAGRREEAIEKSMKEGLITYPQARYLVDSKNIDFKKDYYKILDQQIDKIKVNALVASVEDE